MDLIQMPTQRKAQQKANDAALDCGTRYVCGFQGLWWATCGRSPTAASVQGNRLRFNDGSAADQGLERENAKEVSLGGPLPSR